jgi:hypothetical protein
MISIIKVVKRSSDFDPVFASIVAAWVAYQAQSVISINQLGIGIWGWCLTGLLIGYELNTRENQGTSSQKGLKKKTGLDLKIPAVSLLLAVVAGGIGLAISLPPYLAASKFYKVLQSGDGTLLQQGAYLKPFDRNRFQYTIQILVENKLDQQAIAVLSDAVRIYPNSIELWQRWSQIPTASQDQVARARAEMKRLAPNDPKLK